MICFLLVVHLLYIYIYNYIYYIYYFPLVAGQHFLSHFTHSQLASLMLVCSETSPHLHVSSLLCQPSLPSCYSAPPKLFFLTLFSPPYFLPPFLFFFQLQTVASVCWLMGQVAARRDFRTENGGGEEKAAKKASFRDALAHHNYPPR